MSAKEDRPQLKLGNLERRQGQGVNNLLSEKLSQINITVPSGNTFFWVQFIKAKIAGLFFFIQSNDLRAHKYFRIFSKV